MIDYTANDIDRARIIRAYQYTAHIPENWIAPTQGRYCEDMQRAITAVEAVADTPERKELAITELAAYKARYISLMNAYLASHANVASPGIVGPARFDHDKMMRKQRAAIKHADKFDWHAANGITRMVEKIQRHGAVVNPDTVLFDENGVRVIDNEEAGRTQIIFAETPRDTIIALLRRHAWKYSPRNKAWQRMRTDAARKVGIQIATLASKPKVEA